MHNKIDNKIFGSGPEIKSYLSEDLFRTFTEQTSDVVFITDDKGKIIYLSEANKQVFGYDNQEVAGMHFTQMLASESIEKAVTEFRKAAFENQPTRRLELVMKRKDGTTFTGELNGTLFKSGEISGTAGTIRDISDRVIAAQALKQSEARFREITDMLPQGVYESDLNGNLTYVNRCAFDMFDYSQQEFDNGINIFGLILPEQRQQGLEKFAKIFSERITSNGEYNLLRKDGKILSVFITSAPIIVEGEIKGIRGSIVDISERIKIEHTIRESEEKYKAAFTTSPDAICIKTMDDVFVDFNDVFLELTGYSHNELIGVQTDSLNLWAVPEDKFKIIKELQKSGFVNNYETDFRMKSGLIRNCTISVRIISLNQIPHILSITRDITERKKMENEIIAAKLKAEESDKLKSAFLSNMSHEIRTPLNAILGFSSLLNEDYITEEERQQYSALIKKRSYDLLNIISDILDISKIESGQMRVSNTLEDLNQLLDDVYYSFKSNPSFTNKLKLEFRLNNELEKSKIKLITDPFRVKQVMFNFLNNAFKFTYSGFVELGCMKPESNFITFYVKDSGIGIPETKQKVIFERFRQADESYTRNHDGTGLGLSIAKGLVELLGGKIGLISTEKEGSTFYFTVPLKI
jgi:PAS domain S-box-containing protein